MKERVADQPKEASRHTISREYDIHFAAGRHDWLICTLLGDIIELRK